MSSLNQRLTEVSRLGFETCVIPRNNNANVPKGLRVIEVSNIGEALASVLGVRRKNADNE